MDFSSYKYGDKNIYMHFHSIGKLYTFLIISSQIYTYYDCSIVLIKHSITDHWSFQYPFYIKFEIAKQSIFIFSNM